MTSGKRKVAFKTLGCRLNQFETGSLATQFQNAGYELVDFRENADVFIVNTCTVTNQSDHKSRNIISQATRKGEDPVVIVTGCMADNKSSFLQNDKITYVVGNNSKSDIFSVVDAHFKGEVFQLDKSRKVFNFNNPDKIYKTRGTVKIQDGCDNYCTFCIIPFVRGRAISRPIIDILDNVKQLINKGYHEIVITGVNIGRYKYENYRFEDILEKILDLPGDFRLRISSMEPEGIGDKFLELISHPKLCPHLHLCLQSGSDQILLKMRRMYDMKAYFDLVERIRLKDSNFNFTTDILVGFPGETEIDFNQTVSAIHKIEFGHIHTFKYSLRDGTRAARMKDQVTVKVKDERSKLIRELSLHYQKKFMEKMTGKIQTVLAEKKGRKGKLFGYSEYYLPVLFKGNNNIIDTFQKVKLAGIEESGDLYSIAQIL